METKEIWTKQVCDYLNSRAIEFNFESIYDENGLDNYLDQIEKFRYVTIRVKQAADETYLVIQIPTTDYVMDRNYEPTDIYWALVKRSVENNLFYVLMQGSIYRTYEELDILINTFVKEAV